MAAALCCPTCQQDLTAEAESTLDSGLCPMCQSRIPVETLHALQSLPRLQSAPTSAPHHPAPTAPPAPSAPVANGAAAQDPAPGSVLAGCRIERLLGRGGMGAVYLAHHLALELDVAIKVLPPAIPTDDAQTRERFIREARAVAKLNHPHMIRVLHAGCEAGWHFIVMEHVEGGSLEQRLRNHARLPVAEALRILQETVDGLACAHDHGIVHRDIKPDNILLTKDGAVKVADFGLAKRVGQDPALTCAGSGMGTPNYIAPEQASDAVGVDHRADLYSLGCTAYRMLTGHVPYEGRTPYETVSMHLHAPVPDASSLCPDLPPALTTLLRRLMAKSPADRYPDAHTLLAAICALHTAPGHASAGMPPVALAARTIPQTPSGADAPALATNAPQTPPAAPTGTPRIPRVAWVAGGILLAGGITVAVHAPSFFSSGDSADPAAPNGSQSTQDADKLPEGVVLAHITDFFSGTERPMEGTTTRPHIPEDWEELPDASWELAQIQDLPGGILTDGGIVVHNRGTVAPSYMPSRRAGPRMPDRSEGFKRTEFRFQQDELEPTDVLVPGDAPSTDADTAQRTKDVHAALDARLKRQEDSTTPPPPAPVQEEADWADGVEDALRPPTLLQLYHAAQAAQRAEEWGDAARLYEKALAAHPEFLDLHLPYIVVLEKEIGFQGVRDLYARRQETDPCLTERLVTVLLQPAAQQGEQLDALADEFPDAAPVWYYLARRARTAPTLSQTSAQAEREAYAIRQFHAADQAGGLLPYFLDSARADAMRRELDARRPSIPHAGDAMPGTSASPE